MKYGKLITEEKYGIKHTTYYAFSKLLESGVLQKYQHKDLQTGKTVICLKLKDNANNYHFFRPRAIIYDFRFEDNGNLHIIDEIYLEVINFDGTRIKITDDDIDRMLGKSTK